MAAATRIIRNTLAHLRVHGWLVRDILRCEKWRVMPVVGLSFVGVSMQMAAIGVLLLYVDIQSKGKSPVVLGWELPSGVTPGVVSAWGGAALVLALAGAAALYLTETLTFSVARNYTKVVAGRILRTLSSGGTPWLPKIEGVPESNRVAAARRLLMRDTSMVLRMALILIRMVKPLATFALAALALLLLDPKVTLGVLVLVGAYLVPFYFLNRSVLRASRTRETIATESGGMAMRVVSLLAERTSIAEHRLDWPQAYYDDTPMESELTALRSILLARKRTQLLQGIFFGLALVLVLFIYAAFAGTNGPAWVALAAYLAALKYASSSMNTSASILTAANRFLPQGERLARFSSKNEALWRETDRPRPGRGPGPGDGRVTLTAVAPKLPETLASAQVGPGDVVFCVHDAPINALCVSECLRAFARGGGEGPPSEDDVFFFGRITALPALTVGEVMTGARQVDPAQEQRIRAHLEAAGVSEEFDALPDGLATVLELGLEARLSPRLRYVIGLMSGLLSPRPVFMLTWVGLNRAGADTVLSLLCDRLVLLVHDGMPPEPPPAADLCLVMDGRGVHGLGDAAWFAALYDSEAGRSLRAAAADDFDMAALDEELLEEA